MAGNGCFFAIAGECYAPQGRCESWLDRSWKSWTRNRLDPALHQMPPSLCDFMRAIRAIRGSRPAAYARDFVAN
jgi:hypothetical protein